ncbi:hypothetical protein [Methylopila sp. M107]|uniref:hypothetical protein n=1 Tax=Methylopila sp. M107 TaxID=1101190 RepID=UPI00036FAEC0|nr:hypothetical protein [Methylopila sp. M107]
MKNFFRWTGFTLGVALVGVTLAFGLLFVGRLYAGLQHTAVVFSLMTLYSIGVTIAAINFASKLEDEAKEEADAGGSIRLPTRDQAESEV